ncbi:cytochrome ubiquinol oxidase subunit I [Candidatus Kaiserbacteria bacterium]|nr:cytochrome ubiquinol oxidase subunit I [Candidatus Kaiserbacteria bacterium]
MDPLTISRFQFGDTAAFHILWPLLSIGLSLFMFFMEWAWLRTGDVRYYRQVRFWSKIFILTFGIGTASGIPLEFEFGTNWAAFSNAAGDFFGNILGFESTVAFALEAAFLGIFVFGWKRVSPRVHLFSNAMIAVGATLSAFWIMVANSWMQAPVGVVVENGKIIVTDYMVAIFNSSSFISFLHMEIACVETTLFFILGLCAWALLRTRTTDEYKRFFLQAFKFALTITLVVTPLQIGLGDLSGYLIAEKQPEKVAAMELHWDTNPAGTGAPWSIIAWPDSAGGRNAFDIAIPDALSLLTTHSFSGEVPGLNDYAPSDRPTTLGATITFYSFRIMVAIGFALFGLMLLGVWYHYKGRLDEAVSDHRFFWKLWIFAMPLGFIATEAGWMVREIGRQPWVVYHLLRTSDGLSSGLSTPVVLTTTVLFTLLYIAFGVLFVYFTYRIMKNGPDFVELPPSRVPGI